MKTDPDQPHTYQSHVVSRQDELQHQPGIMQSSKHATDTLPENSSFPWDLTKVLNHNEGKGRSGSQAVSRLCCSYADILHRDRDRSSLEQNLSRFSLGWATCPQRKPETHVATSLLLCKPISEAKVILKGWWNKKHLSTCMQREGPSGPTCRQLRSAMEPARTASAHTGKLPAEEFVAGLDLPVWTRDREKPVAQK